MWSARGRLLVEAQLLSRYGNQSRPMNSYRIPLALMLFAACSAQAQSPEVTIQEPQPVRFLGPVLKPFHLQRRIVSPVKLTNSPRLESLVRGGNLYLSVQDVIALVLENNLDIAIQRYGPLLAREVLRRTQGGGFLRSVGYADQCRAAERQPGRRQRQHQRTRRRRRHRLRRRHRHSNRAHCRRTWTPTCSPTPVFAHTTTPLSNTVLSQTTALTNDVRQYQFGYGQSCSPAPTLQVTYSSAHSRVNSPANLLNPATIGLSRSLHHAEPAAGFSVAVNNRNIRVARNNTEGDRACNSSLQAITTVLGGRSISTGISSASTKTSASSEQALSTAEKLFEDNKKQVELGALPAIEVTRAAAEVSSSQRRPADLANQRRPAGNHPEERSSAATVAAALAR